MSGTTTTTIAMATETGGSCPIYSYNSTGSLQDDPADALEFNPDPPDQSNSRLARFRLAKRPPPTTWVGDQLIPSPKDPVTVLTNFPDRNDICDIGFNGPINFPRYPKGGSFSKHPRFNQPSGPQGAFLTGRDQNNPFTNQCGTMIWAKVVPGFPMRNPPPGIFKYTQPGPSRVPPYVNIDHVYEISLLRYFLEALVYPHDGAHPFPCDWLQRLLLEQDRNVHSDDQSRLQTIYDQVNKRSKGPVDDPEG
ncbi:MAG: hypothetical protein Q9227_003201 [Pyrenula ochraceoflavens]